MINAEIKLNGKLTNLGQFQNLSTAQAWYFANQQYFPDGHIVDFVDVTVQFSDALRIDFAEKKINLGRRVLAMVQAINTKKLELGTLTLEQLTLMVKDPTLITIERFLSNGYLEFANELIKALPNTYFNGEDIENISEFIDEWLASNS
jgi:hypothetical protein